MELQQFGRPQSGKLVRQLPSGITFAYNLRLGHSSDHCKGLIEEYYSGMGPGKSLWISLRPLRCKKKRHLLPQNGPKSLGPRKSWKNCHIEIIVFELVE